MANIRLIRRRIRSAKNIAQITRAMELVAASKMKRAQQQAVSGKLYAQKIYDMVTRLSRNVDAHHHPLLARPKTIRGKRMVILISTNKGLCGGLNTSLFRFLLRHYRTLTDQRFVTLGKKGLGLVMQAGGDVVADFSHLVPFVTSVPSVAQLVIAEYLGGTIDGVDLVYSEFVSALRQEPHVKTILPLTLEGGGEGNTSPSGAHDYVIEPSAPEVFASLLPHYVENQIRDAILGAQASEHSARMVAMRNATDSALSLMGELTLLYNKARQEKITYEISDMVTARLAVEGV